MQHAVFAKGSKQVMDAFGTDYLKSSFRNYMKRHKGYKALNKQVQFSDANGTDFIENKVTGIMYFNLYKCPRFAR